MMHPKEITESVMERILPMLGRGADVANIRYAILRSTDSIISGLSPVQTDGRGVASEQHTEGPPERDEASPLALLTEAVRAYLAYLASDQPLDEAFQNIKGRVVTIACMVVGEEQDPLRVCGKCGQPIRPDEITVGRHCKSQQYHLHDCDGRWGGVVPQCEAKQLKRDGAYRCELPTGHSINHQFIKVNLGYTPSCMVCAQPKPFKVCDSTGIHGVCYDCAEDPQPMTTDALASVLCHTEDSGLFTDPETADKVAAFVTAHYTVIAK